MGHRIFNSNNIRKAIRYCRKNGWKHTFFAAMERTKRETGESYVYEPLSEFALREQIDKRMEFTTKFSILVPAYETRPDYLRELMESVLNQTYGELELILADASRGGQVEQVVKEYQDDRIRYVRLQTNDGISENTNRALALATGDYVGLLDHDDLLTPDALFEMAKAIREQEKKGVALQLLYSDEDKCDETAERFYEPHRKQELNIDLIMTNNYICHFMVIKRELIQQLGLRKDYDGAQDYDLVLRALQQMLGTAENEGAETPGMILKKLPVYHINRILYHWRCHSASTAENPDSKRYAYEANKRAVEDFLRNRGIEAAVVHSAHLGFYRIQYPANIFESRQDLGIVGGKLLNRRNKITGGIYKADGTVEFADLPAGFSGYMNRAALQQDAYAVDVRCMKLAPAVEAVWEQVFGLPPIKREDGWLDWKSCVNEEADYVRLSIQFCEAVRRAGYGVLWDPQETVVLKR